MQHWFSPGSPLSRWKKIQTVLGTGTESRRALSPIWCYTLMPHVVSKGLEKISSTHLTTNLQSRSLLWLAISTLYPYGIVLNYLNNFDNFYHQLPASWWNFQRIQTKDALIWRPCKLWGESFNLLEDNTKDLVIQPTVHRNFAPIICSVVWKVIDQSFRLHALDTSSAIVMLMCKIERALWIQCDISRLIQATPEMNNVVMKIVV